MRGGRTYDTAFVAVLATLRGEDVAYVVMNLDKAHAQVARATRHLQVHATRNGDAWSIGRTPQAKHGTISVSRP